MWSKTQMYLASILFAISITFPSVHMLKVHSVKVVDKFSMDLNEIMYIFDAMIEEASSNVSPSLASACPVKPVHVAGYSIVLSKILSKQTPKPEDIRTWLDSPTSKNPFVPPRVCVVSKRELDEIWDALQDDESNEIGSTIVTSSNCTELEKVKIRILKLKSLFKEILKHRISSAKYEELKASYENKVRLLRKKIDDVKKEASKEHETETEEDEAESDEDEIAKTKTLKGQLKKLRSKISIYFKKTEEDQKVINEAIVQLVVADIDRNQIDSALELFNVNITNKSQIRHIIPSVYNGTDSNFNKILSFLRRVNDSDAVLLGYTSLHDEMKTKNQMKGLNILLMSLEVFKKREGANFTSLVGSLIDTMKQLHTSNGFDSFYEFANKDNDLVKEIMEIYVQVGFDGNYENTQKILDLMSKFDKLIHKMYLLNNLISELKVPGRTEFGSEYTPEMFVMIHNIIQLRSQSKDDRSTRDAIEDLENNIPEVLRDLMFKNLCIQNMEDNSYLYAGDTTDDNRRMALTSKLSEKFEIASSWQIEFIENGKKFLFKNEKYNEHLYVRDSGHPQEARLWRPNNLKDNTQAHFTIELQNIHLGTFRIFSPKYGGNLGVSELFGDSRTVRSMSKADSDGLLPNQRWFIKTCRFSF